MKTRSLTLLGFLATMLGCNNDPSPYYVVAEVRAPVLQLLQKATDTNTDPARKDCVSLDIDGEQGAAAPEVWCQQYPVRPDAPLLLKFVVLSPAPNGADFNIAIEKVTRLSGLGSQLNTRGAGRIGSSDTSNSEQEDLQAFELREVGALRKTVLEEPLKVQEYYYSIKLPSANTLFQDFQTKGALPAFSLQYTVQAAQTANYRSDKGFVSFYVVPDPASRVFEAILGGFTGSGANSGSGAASENQPPALSEEAIAELKEQAKSNTPPEILSFGPEAKSLAANAQTRLEIALGADNDQGSKSRVLWFVSSGKLSNNKSKRPNWNPESAGKGTAFVMVRDLQGGSDYKIKSFDLE